MLRLRFLPGLIVGLLVGLPLGAIVAVLAFPPSRGESAATAVEIQQLSRRLEQAEQDKQALNRQLDDFRKMAERMTASFTDLTQRFNSLEKEMRAAEQAPPPPSTPTVAPAAASPPPSSPSVPEPAPTSAATP